MKSARILFLLLSFVALSAFSAQAQEEQKVKKTTTTDKKKADKTERKYMVGSKGGCYYLTEAGKKSYVDKKFCEGLTTSTTDSTTQTKPTETVTEKTSDQTDIEATEAKTEEKTPAAETESKTSETKPTEPVPADVVTTENKKTEPKPATEKKSNSDRKYIKGSRGGCYYLSESGKKVYVKDKSLCEQ